VSKTLLVLSAFAVLLLITTEALANAVMVEGRNPIIYSPNGNEVGVLRRFMPGGLAVMQPSRKTLGMGHYNVVLSQQNLKPRARGGWETDLTLDQIAYLPPVDRNRFWMPSGV
jgi:hypothetical protein